MTTQPEQDTDKAMRRALADPGSVTPRMLDETADQYEPLTGWQLRALRIAALPLITAAERERCALLAERVGATYPHSLIAAGPMAGQGRMEPFAAAIRDPESMTR